VGIKECSATTAALQHVVCSGTCKVQGAAGMKDADALVPTPGQLLPYTKQLGLFAVSI
jgi:hypothetical protein